jgi:hypothetical protein
MAIPNTPLEQRLEQILPEASPPGEMPLEPMPGEQAQPIEMPEVADQPGTPSMEDPLQVAGLGTIIRRAARQAEPKAVRNIVPEAARAPVDELPPMATEGRFRVIPEASQELTEQVEAAVSRRQKFSPLTGTPPEEAFNLSMYSTRDAAGVIGGVADALGIKTERVTFKEISAQANAAGIDEKFLSRLVDSNGKMMANAVDTKRALDTLDASAIELDRLFKLVADGQATDAQKLQLRQQVALHGMIQKGVKGIQTETARALAVFRIPRDSSADVIRGVLDEFGGEGSLTDMARAYLSLETRAARNQLVEKSMLSGVKDIWFSTFINGLLSSPVSHAKNILGNSMFGIYQIPERLVAAFYSNTLPAGVRSWKQLVPGTEAEKIGYDEALTMVQSLRNGVVEGMQLAAEAFKKNQPSDLKSKLEMQRTPMESMGETLQRVTGVDQNTWMGKAFDYYGTAVTLPGRALMTEDEFFKGVFYRMQMNTLVTRRGKQVYREAIDAGMPEADAIAKAQNEVTDLLANPPRDLDEAAMDFARRGTFTSDLPPALASLQRVFNTPALKVVVPFFKTPANIGLEVIERTPFAPLSSKWRNEIAQGGIYRDMALAKVTLGSAVLATFGAIASEGLLTGRGPERKADREALLRDGWKPYSFKIGDEYYSYAGLEPVSALLAIAADYAEYARHEKDSTKIEQVFLGATYGLYEYLKEQPYLQGIADIAKLIGTNQQGQVDGKKIVNELAKQYGGFVIGGSPAGAYGSLVASIERLIDPMQRDVRTNPDLPMGVRGFYEAFNRYRSRLPYASEALPPALNLWGDPVLSGQGKAYELVLPTRVSPSQFSEVDDALVRMGSPVGMPERKIDGIEMDAMQYNRLLTIYGKELPSKQKLLDLVQTPGFDLLDTGDQQQRILSVHSTYMDTAKNMLLAEDPNLRAKIDELKELRRANGRYYKPD